MPTFWAESEGGRPSCRKRNRCVLFFADGRARFRFRHEGRPPAGFRPKGGHENQRRCRQRGQRSFARIVSPALKHIDYCILNEIEAGKTTGFNIRETDGALNTVSLRHAAGALLQGGVRELVVIHFPEGCFMRTRKGEDFWQSSLKLPDKHIAGTAARVTPLPPACSWDFTKIGNCRVACSLEFASQPHHCPTRLAPAG